MSEDRPRTLPEWLRGRSDEWLLSLLRARPDLAVPVPSDVGVLASRIGIRISLGRAMDDLDAFTLQVLDGLVLLAHGRASVAGLRELLPTDRVGDEELGSAVERLRAIALIWGPDDDLHVVVGVHDLTDLRPGELGRPVATLLAGLDAAELTTVLATLDLSAPAGDAVPTVAAELADPKRLGALLDTAGPDEVHILSRLAAGSPHGGLPDARRVLRAGHPDTPVRWLMTRGLIVPSGPDVVELPREVGLAVREVLPLGPVQLPRPTLTGRAHDPGTVDTTAGGLVMLLLRRVEQVLELFGQQTPAPLRSGGLGVRELRRIARESDLSEADLALILEVTRAGGLLTSNFGATAIWAPTKAFDKWLTRPPAERWATLVTAWLEMPAWPGLVGQRDEYDKPINALTHEASRVWAPAVRRRVLTALADLPPGAAATPAELSAQLRWAAPRQAGLTTEPGVAAVLTEADHLGLLGRGALTTAGRALLDGGRPADLVAGTLPAPVEHVLIQADLTVVAPGPLAPPLAREIDLVADVESSGGATVYRVDERTVRRALDAGRGAADLHELFATRSRTPVPQALTYLIDDVARRHGRLRVGSATAYLRCDDESLLTELLADKRAAGLGLRRLAPTVLLSTTAVTPLLQSLRTIGYAPAAEDATGAVVIAKAQGKRLTNSAAGHYQGPPRLGDNQLREVVRSLRVTDRNRRRPAPTSLGAATRNGISVPGVTSAGVLELLGAAAEQDLPVWLGYVDGNGVPSERLVQVERVLGGVIEAWDVAARLTKTFLLHRITSAALDEEDSAAW